MGRNYAVGVPGGGAGGRSGAGAGTSMSGPGGLISGGGELGWLGCEGWGCSGGTVGGSVAMDFSCCAR